jgi:hypothetical protein
VAHFDQHCADCQRLLGDRYEEVNRWIDELFKLHGADHRRYRHHAGGVRQAQKKFGGEAYKAAIVHIVRDCGFLPLARHYQKPLWGDGDITITPEYLTYDGLNEKAQEKFDRAVQLALENFSPSMLEM